MAKEYAVIVARHIFTLLSSVLHFCVQLSGPTQRGAAVQGDAQFLFGLREYVLFSKLRNDRKTFNVSRVSDCISRHFQLRMPSTDRADDLMFDRDGVMLFFRLLYKLAGKLEKISRGRKLNLYHDI